MQPDLHGSVVVPRTARWVAYGEPESARERWIVLHGYGQLAEAFLAECAVLRAPHRLVVAPEALSRFYTRGMSEVPGASWMTREARDDEITDQIGYLDRLDALLNDRLNDRLSDQQSSVTRSVVLGFSQGAATAARWSLHGAARVDHLICWAGGFPLDLPEDLLRSRFADLRLTLVVGSRDRLIPADRVEKMCDRLNQFGVDYSLRRFDGGHRLDNALLRELANE